MEAANYPVLVSAWRSACVHRIRGEAFPVREGGVLLTSTRGSLRRSTPTVQLSGERGWQRLGETASRPRVQPLSQPALDHSTTFALAASRFVEPASNISSDVTSDVIPGSSGVSPGSSHVSPGVRANDLLPSDGTEAEPVTEADAAAVTAAAVTYLMRLKTSSDLGSGLMNPSDGVQFAIIGESGKSFSGRAYPGTSHAASETEAPLQAHAGGARSVATPTAASPKLLSAGTLSLNVVFASSGERAFNEGGTAVLSIRGPDIRPIAALWLAPAGDTWRLAEASLCVLEPMEVQQPVTPSESDSEANYEAQGGFDLFENSDDDDDDDVKADSEIQALYKRGTLYAFRPDEDVLLGATGDAMAVELRPFSVQPLDQQVLIGMLQGSLYLDKADALVEEEADALRRELERREGLDEYRRLKEWLLLSTAVIVVIGTFVADQIGGDGAGAAFAVGGLLSVLYLVKLQRQVDSLPSQQIDLRRMAESRSALALSEMSSNSPELPVTDREEAASLKAIPGADKDPHVANVNGVLPRVLRLATLVLCLALVAVVVSNGAKGGAHIDINSLHLPKLSFDQFVAATLGFFTHRIPVLFAAFRGSSKS